MDAGAAKIVGRAGSNQDYATDEPQISDVSRWYSNIVGFQPVLKNIAIVVRVSRTR